MSKCIMIDLDGVLADFMHGFTCLSRAIHGETPIVHAACQPSLSDIPGMTDAMKAATWAYLVKDHRFWIDLMPLVPISTFNRIAGLAHDHRVYFITNRTGMKCKQQTEAWLTSYGIWRPTVLISGDKGELCRALGVTHVLEDQLDNIGKIASVCQDTQCYVLNRHYNQTDIDLVFQRVYSVEDFLNIVEGE